MSLTNAYVTLERVAAETNNRSTDNDIRLEAAINAASRQIDDYTGRRFWQDDTVQTREFFADDHCELISQVDQVMDISTTTGLVVKLDTANTGTYSTTLTIGTHFILTPPNAADDGEPFTGIRLVDGTYSFLMSSRPNVQVTAKFGFAAIPPAVEQACLVQSILLYKASDAALGGLSFGDGAFMRIRGGLNPIAQSLIERYTFARVA